MHRIDVHCERDTGRTLRVVPHTDVCGTRLFHHVGYLAGQLEPFAHVMRFVNIDAPIAFLQQDAIEHLPKDGSLVFPRFLNRLLIPWPEDEPCLTLLLLRPLTDGHVLTEIRTVKDRVHTL